MCHRAMEKVVERFSTFLLIECHTGEYLADTLFNYFKSKCLLNFKLCRGQSYDNAANMAEKFNGMQQRILERNKFALFVLCAGHSINLVSCAAVDCCLEVVNFFGRFMSFFQHRHTGVQCWKVIWMTLLLSNVFLTHVGLRTAVWLPLLYVNFSLSLMLFWSWRAMNHREVT